ncbi:MAG: RIP metalloprotease RseP [Deltaproteobacteria bacterium]|jgi:regulator of sigma E protease|nr:RIP metalloprotease RseP [Deltaproteobacteria bacterium]
MSVIDTLVAVIPMLGILIVAHELGHFLVAKACGVRVLKFSIGFGAPIGFGRMRLRWERGGTEYVIGWIPLGGFVRMLGEPMPGDETAEPPVPEDVRPDEFLEARPVWQKLSVVFAGPLMNLLLPIVFLMGILWVGLPRPNAVVGSVEAGSPAAIAGIEPGDRIVSLDGEPVEWWDEVLPQVRERTEAASLDLEIERDGTLRQLEVPLGVQRLRDRFGAVVDRGWIGLGHRRLAALVGVPEAGSVAAEVGLRSGDLVVAISRAEAADAGEASSKIEVLDWEALREAHRSAALAARDQGARSVVWHVEREVAPIEPPAPPGTAETPQGASPPGGSPAERPPPESLALVVPALSELAELGLRPATILVGYVSEGKPAERAGLRANDLVLAVDGQAVGSFESFVSRVQTSGGRELTITFSRDGVVQETHLAAQEETVAGPYDIEGMEEKVFQIGLGAALSSLPGARSTLRVRNPIESLPRAVEMTRQMTRDYLLGLGKLFTGEVGADKLSGPIGIARIARKSLDRGWLDYLSMMMLISINLGILNLLPIPILDGGQAVIYSIEGIKRSPLSMRTRELATSVGFALLVLLMGRAFWNDLTPFWTKFVGWLSNGPQ